MSMDSQVFTAVPAQSVDFIYIDSSHLYDVTKKELKAYWRLLKRGGVLAGHDYCDHGESAVAAATESHACRGCYPVPRCLPYTEYGLAHGKPGGVPSRSQTAVVKAVQKWVMQNGHSLHFTSETFTRSSLRADSMDYDLVITNSRNPSWFVVKGHGPDSTQHGRRNEVTVAELAGWRQPATAAQTTEMMLRPFASDLAVGVVSAPGRRYLRQALHSVLTGMAPEASPAQQQHMAEPQVPVHVFAATLFSKSQRQRLDGLFTDRRGARPSQVVVHDRGQDSNRWHNQQAKCKSGKKCLRGYAPVIVDETMDYAWVLESLCSLPSRPRAALVLEDDIVAAPSWLHTAAAELLEAAALLRGQLVGPGAARARHGRQPLVDRLASRLDIVWLRSRITECE